MKIVIDIPEEIYKECVSVNVGKGHGKTIIFHLKDKTAVQTMIDAFVSMIKPTQDKHETMDNDIKTALNEIHGIHERIRQCNERYEKRMAELERPVEFYDINGPLKITREEDNNG
jgi:hypothetical protein